MGQKGKGVERGEMGEGHNPSARRNSHLRSQGLARPARRRVRPAPRTRDGTGGEAGAAGSNVHALQGNDLAATAVPGVPHRLAAAPRRGRQDTRRQCGRLRRDTGGWGLAGAGARTNPSGFTSRLVGRNFRHSQSSRPASKREEKRSQEKRSSSEQERELYRYVLYVLYIHTFIRRARTRESAESGQCAMRRSSLSFLCCLLLFFFFSPVCLLCLPPTPKRDPPQAVQAPDKEERSFTRGDCYRHGWLMGRPEEPRPHLQVGSAPCRVR